MLAHSSHVALLCCAFNLKMKELFVRPFQCTLCTLSLFVTCFEPFIREKILLSDENKVFRANLDNMKEIQINWVSFLIVRDQKCHVKIRVFLMTCLFDLYFM